MSTGRPPGSLLDSPARSGAVQLASRTLRTAEEEAPRLDDAEDTQAVHDFRVAVRRLRTILRTYANVLGLDDSVQLELRKLASVTNTTRDNEAHAEWLEEALAAGELDAAQREATEELLGEIRASLERPPELTAGAQRVLGEVEVALRATSAGAGVAPPARGVMAFGQATSDVIERVTRQLRKRLSRIRTLEDTRFIHRARLSEKRLRYVLEPIASEVPGADRALERLKELQDALGELHDLSGLHARVAGDATDLHSLITARRRQLFEAVAAQWLGDAADSFFRNIEDIRDSLSGPDE